MLPIGCWLALFCKDISIVTVIRNWFPSPSMACSHPKCSPPVQGSLKLIFLGSLLVIQMLQEQDGLLVIVKRRLFSPSQGQLVYD